MPVNPAATSIPKVPVEGPRAPGSDGGDKMTPGRRAAIPDPLALALARPPALGSGATAKLSQKRRLAEETAGSVGCSRERILGKGGASGLSPRWAELPGGMRKCRAHRRSRDREPAAPIDPTPRATPGGAGSFAPGGGAAAG